MIDVQAGLRKWSQFHYRYLSLTADRLAPTAAILTSKPIVTMKHSHTDPNSSWLAIQILKSIPDVAGVVVALFLHVLLENNSPHQTSRCTAAGEQLELSEALLGQDVQTVQCNPATVGEGSNLLHERCVEGFVC